MRENLTVGVNYSCNSYLVQQEQNARNILKLVKERNSFRLTNKQWPFLY